MNFWAKRVEFEKTVQDEKRIGKFFWGEVRNLWTFPDEGTELELLNLRERNLRGLNF